MDVEDGVWVMYGCDENDPYCIHTVEQLIEYIDEVGFLPLFKNDIPGFSVEERTVASNWWCEDEKRDPWEWRRIIAASGKVCYGKFFDKKAGFISLKWLPYFVNARRDGYDFDALWEDEKASLRQKKIMDAFLENAENDKNVEPEASDETPYSRELFSNELKQIAGFGKGGEKNFEGTVTALQMQTYLCVRDFRQRKNKKGELYGWAIAVYTAPEHIWGYDVVTAAYNEKPEKSRERIVEHMKDIYPIATEKQIHKVIG